MHSHISSHSLTLAEFTLSNCAQTLRVVNHGCEKVYCRSKDDPSTRSEWLNLGSVGPFLCSF